MSLARVLTTKKSRKPWTCSKCRREIPVGSPVLSFTVGFRGWEQKRCADNPSCYPTLSERESSRTADIYAAIEGVDLSSCDSLEDLESAREDVANACSEVADEYESSEMYDVNEQLQERAEQIRAAGEELEGWEPEREAPEEEDEDSWNGNETFEEAMDEWLEEARSSLQDAIDSLDLP